MKPINGNQSRRIGFTSIELLTVMSIIVILISLLTPALNRVRRYATDVKQRAQFHAIAVALDMFNAEFDGYPDSNAVDDRGHNYCGAMRLAEAMVGQDLKGFNPTSLFERRGFWNISDTPMPWDGMPYPPYDSYGVTTGSATAADGITGTAHYNENLRSRKMYLELEHANAYMLKDIYDNTAITTLAFDADNRRLGRGAGYYDRFLSGISNRIPSVGLAFDFQMVKSLPYQPHDAVMSHVITN